MTWVGWRLQRIETLIALGILALLAALLVPTGIQMADAYHHDGLAACLSVNPSPLLRQDKVGGFQAALPVAQQTSPTGSRSSPV